MISKKSSLQVTPDQLKPLTRQDLKLTRAYSCLVRSVWHVGVRTVFGTGPGWTVSQRGCTLYTVTFIDYGYTVTVSLEQLVASTDDIPKDQLGMVDHATWCGRVLVRSSGTMGWLTV